MIETFDNVRKTLLEVFNVDDVLHIELHIDDKYYFDEINSDLGFISSSDFNQYHYSHIINIIDNYVYQYWFVLFCFPVLLY